MPIEPIDIFQWVFGAFLSSPPFLNPEDISEMSKLAVIGYSTQEHAPICKKGTVICLMEQVFASFFVFSRITMYSRILEMGGLNHFRKGSPYYIGLSTTIP